MLREKAFQSYNFVHRFTAQMILCILLCVPAITHAQNKPVRFEHCSVRQGLSQGSGYSITQDKYGFIWMGTQYGLNRFDGYQVKTFFHGDKGYTGSNHINSLYTDSNGNVWVASTSGLSILESSTRKFTTASRFLKDQTGLDQLNVTKLWGDQRHHVWALSASNTVFQIKPSSTGWLTTAFRLPARPVDITEDGKGTIWLATEHDIFQFDGSRRLFVKRPIPQLSGYVISALVVDKEDRLWVGTFDNGIYLISLHGKNEKTPIRLVEGKDEGSISSNAVTCLLKDNQNDIWIGTRTGGLNKYQNGKIIQNRHRDDVAESLAKDFVLSLFEDRQGNIWVGLSGEGFDKHDPFKFQFQSIRHSQHDPSTIGDNMIFAIRRLVPGYLHFGTQLSGLSVLDESSGKFVNFKKDLSGANSIIHNTVYDLAYDGKGLIWIATWGGLCSYDIKKPKSSFQTYDDQQGRIRNLYAVHKQKKENTLWLSGVNGLFRFDTRLKQWIPWTSERDKTIGSQVVWVFYEDDQQNIWMGTENNSVIRYHLPSQKVNTIPVGAAGTKNVVRCLKPEGSRYLWIGADNGWMKLDRHTLRIVQHYSTKNGLPDNVVYAMEMDKGGNWWLSTNKGLVVYRKSDRSFRSYDAADGLQGNEFNTKSSYADSSGKLYFGGINGFNVFDPSDLRSNRFAPDVRFTTVKLFDTVYLSDLELDGVGELQLNHRQNFISFEFAALDYSFSEKANYTYVMEGLDDNWLNNGARRYISYTGLKPGHYTFKVKYQNRDGVASNNIAMLRIYISPPWWQTWWAYSLLSCIAAVVVYTAYRRHIGRLQKKQAEQISTMVATQENERRRISRDLHDDIGTKLSAIKLYVSSFRDKLDQQRLDEAKGMAENSEQLINDTMTDLRQMLLNLSPSVLEEFGYAVAVEGLVNKINETKLIHFDLVMFGLKENLHRDYELALYRITQELINNVLKHAEATEVSLQIGYREGKIILMMEDNGKGFDVYSHRDGYGLKNLEARTQLLQGTMVIDSLPGRGTNVLIEIPYKMNGHA